MVLPHGSFRGRSQAIYFPWVIHFPQVIHCPYVIFPLRHDDTAFSSSLNMFCTALITLALAP